MNDKIMLFSTATAIATRYARMFKYGYGYAMSKVMQKHGITRLESG
ncbi:MAG: hypothetical protein AB7U37_05840 [Synergistaceae bacterium]